MHPGEDEEGQYQFGGVAKADLEQPAEALPARCASWPVARRSKSAGTARGAAPIRKIQLARASARRKCNVEQGMRDKQQQGVGDPRKLIPRRQKPGATGWRGSSRQSESRRTGNHPSAIGGGR